MKAKFLSQYRTEKGTIMFRYSVSGTEEQIEAFKTAQGEFFRADDDGKPVYFSNRYLGENITLGITSKGRVYVDTQALDKAKSLIANNPGVLGDKIAEAVAAQLLADLNKSSARVNAPTAEKAEEKEKESESALDN